MGQTKTWQDYHLRIRSKKPDLIGNKSRDDGIDEPPSLPAEEETEDESEEEEGA